MKITSRSLAYRRARVRRLVCPECGEPARACPPRRWLTPTGPRPRYSHVDGEPLCPVIGAHGYEPARPVRRWRRHRRPVYLVAGGDVVAVFENLDAAGALYRVMVGANLDPVIRRLTPARWATARIAIPAQRAGIEIVDARSSGAGGRS